MARTAVDAVFIDTNVLVAATIVEAPWHRESLASLQSDLVWSSAWISRQVLREYLAVLSRPQQFSRPLPPKALAAQIADFQARYRIAEDSTKVTRKLLELIQKFEVGGRQIHDANIVATMLVHRVGSLLTLNQDDFKRFSPLVSLLHPKSLP